MRETWNARTAYGLVLLVAILALPAAAYAVRRLRQSAVIRLRFDPIVLGTIGFASLLLANVASWHLATFVAAFAMGLALLGIVQLSPKVRMRVALFLLLGFAGVYVTLVLRIPLVLPEDPTQRLFAEWHYSQVLGVADYLANGNQLTDASRFYVGVLGPSIVAWIARIFTDFSYADYLVVVQVAGLLYAAVCVVALYLWTKSWPLAVAAMIPILLPYISPVNHFVQVFPNQSPYRFLALPVGIVGLVLVNRFRSEVAGWVQGAFLAVVLLLSTEIGIAFALAYSCYPVLRSRPLQSWKFAIGWGTLWLSTCAWLAAFALVFFHTFGSAPGTVIETFMPLALTNLRGYAGIVWKTDGYTVECVGILTVALFFISRSSVRWLTRPLTHCEAVEWAVALVVCLWLIRFVDRPAGANLWPYLFPTLFLVSRSIRKATVRPIAVRALLVLVLIGHFPTMERFLGSSRSTLHRWMQAESANPVGMNSVSDWPSAIAKEDAAHLIPSKASFLSLHREARPLVLTLYSFSIPNLAKYWNRGIYLAPFPESFTEEHRQRLIRTILESERPMVMFDALPAFVRSSGKFQPAFEFFDTVREAISHKYELAGEDSGWQIWRLKG